MFSQETIDEIETVAREEGIDAANLLAIAEVESGGKAFAYVSGRKEPLIRFEGHYFDRLLGAGNRAAARKAGLASPRAGVIKNPRNQIDRWRLLARAKQIDRAAAVQSVSWGIGQVMGSHWKALCYASPEALAAEARKSVAGQVRLMVRFIRVNGLASLLAARDWTGFARRYNGPAYRKNHYDTRLAAAYARHRNRKLRRAVAPRIKRGGLLAKGARNNAQAVRDMQRLLTAAGYPVKVDGSFGPQTDAALRRFQTDNHFSVDGVFGSRSREALHKQLPKFGSAGKIWQLLWKLMRMFGSLKWWSKV